MKEVADNVASKVWEAYEKVEYVNWVPLDARQKDIELRLRQPTPAMQKHFEKALKLPEGEFISHRMEKIYAQRIAKLKDGPIAHPRFTAGHSNWQQLHFSYSI